MTVNTQTITTIASATVPATRSTTVDRLSCLASRLDKELVFLVEPDNPGSERIQVHPFLVGNPLPTFTIPAQGLDPVSALERHIQHYTGKPLPEAEAENEQILWSVANDNEVDYAIAQAPPTWNDLLLAILAFLLRFVAFQSESQAVVVTIWIAHTWLLEAFDYSPYLRIFSPTKGCGKSRLFDCIAALSRNPSRVVNPTESVLFRQIESECPTLLIDEVDTIFRGSADRSKESLRALLNAGFERSAKIPRCGSGQSLVYYRVFCPKALAGIGGVPETIADRSIPIELVRRSKDDRIERFRLRELESVVEPIRKLLEFYSTCSELISCLRSLRPGIPDTIGDRAADITEPLLAIAEHAGHDWPQKCQQAVAELCSRKSEEAESHGIGLLMLIQQILTERPVKQISSRALLQEIVEREVGERWAVSWARAVGAGNWNIATAQLAHMLRPFGIISGTIREPNGSTPKGYKFDAFNDAFERYLPG